MLNNKGFAVSTILYGLLIIIMIIVTLLFSIAQQNRENTSSLVDKIEEDLINANEVEKGITPDSDEKLFIVPWNETGWYRIELWAANTNGINGDYVSGFIYLVQGDTISFRVNNSGVTDAILGVDYNDVDKETKNDYSDYPYKNVILRAGFNGNMDDMIDSNDKLNKETTSNFGAGFACKDCANYTIDETDKLNSNTKTSILTKYSSALYDNNSDPIKLTFSYKNPSLYTNTKTISLEYFTDLYTCNNNTCALKQTTESYDDVQLDFNYKMIIMAEKSNNNNYVLGVKPLNSSNNIIFNYDIRQESNITDIDNKRTLLGITADDEIENIQIAKNVYNQNVLPITDLYDTQIIDKEGNIFGGTTYNPTKRVSIVNGYIIPNINTGEGHVSINKVSPREINTDLVDVEEIYDCTTDTNSKIVAINLINKEKRKYKFPIDLEKTGTQTIDGKNCYKYDVKGVLNSSDTFENIDELGLSTTSTTSIEHSIYVKNKEKSEYTTIIDKINVSNNNEEIFSIWQPNYRKTINNNTILPSANYFILNSDNQKEALTSDAKGKLEFKTLSYNDEDYQIWTIAKIEGTTSEGKNIYSIINKASGKCIMYNPSDATNPFVAAESYLQNTEYDIYSTNININENKSFNISSNGNKTFNISVKGNNLLNKANLKLIAIDAIG